MHFKKHRRVVYFGLTALTMASMLMVFQYVDKRFGIPVGEQLKIGPCFMFSSAIGVIIMGAYLIIEVPSVLRERRHNPVDLTTVLMILVSTCILVLCVAILVLGISGHATGDG